MMQNSSDECNRSEAHNEKEMHFVTKSKNGRLYSATSQWRRIGRRPYVFISLPSPYRWPPAALSCLLWCSTSSPSPSRPIDLLKGGLAPFLAKLFYFAWTCYQENKKLVQHALFSPLFRAISFLSCFATWWKISLHFPPKTPHVSVVKTQNIVFICEIGRLKSYVIVISDILWCFCSLVCTLNVIKAQISNQINWIN